jgi:hypothetical protein
MPIQQRSQLKGFGQSTNEKYIVEDIQEIVTEVNSKPHKVFTALLTQSGGDDPRFMQGDGGGDISSATKGTTVQIFANLNNINYSSIGAPNSNVGTYFILTQDITLSNLDNETIFAINTGAPVATVLENTLGNVWFTYQLLGSYQIFSNGLFTLNKTWTYPNNTQSIPTDGGSMINLYFDGLNSIILESSNDDIISYGGHPLRLEIRVYN